ncbi:MAG: LLM class flavin-dependent oxidoreductase [Nitriliruptoraceae bacterium]|nr:LLM class flavin-dependent oxidoreductase [Nitriliruptoraceae bacterium]
MDLSILDLAPIHRGESVGDALAGSVRLARLAEAAGYRRVWYAEHHNMPVIASAATSVLIAHVAAHTTSIRLGSGGVMLPNHSPLTIAEQFGTLAALHPGRIELGVGRAPGTDPRTLAAMRRSPGAAERFPDDVRELQGYLRDRSTVPGVRAVPGAGSDVPVWILGSSLFGAQLAAHLGLPYAFASHFAPAALREAVAAYRARFEPSEACPTPRVMLAVNVIASEDADEADRLLRRTAEQRVKLLFGGGPRAVPAGVAGGVVPPRGAAAAWDMLRCRAVGRPEQVVRTLDAFAEEHGADELMLASCAPDRMAALRTIELVAAAREPTSV